MAPSLLVLSFAPIFSFAPAAHAQNDGGAPAMPAGVFVDGVTINGPAPPELRRLSPAMLRAA